MAAAQVGNSEYINNFCCYVNSMHIITEKFKVTTFTKCNYKNRACFEFHIIIL